MTLWEAFRRPEGLHLGGPTLDAPFIPEAP
jgi:hypothetical protein